MVALWSTWDDAETVPAGIPIVTVLLVTTVVTPLDPLKVNVSVNRLRVSLPVDPLIRRSVTSPVSCDPSPLNEPVNEPVAPADAVTGP